MPRDKSIPTQNIIDIDYIKDDVVVLKSGGLRKILLTSGINIELKSEEEQNTIYSEYQNFLNGSDFSLQFLVHSRKLNIDKYLKLLEERENEEPDELLKSELSEYREFIRSFVAENDIMTKNFFVVVPFEPINLPSQKQISKILPDIMPFGKKAAKNAPSEEDLEQLQRDIFQLNQRVDHVIAGLHTIGLRAVVLNQEELLELFYNLYNPESTEKKDLDLAQSQQGAA